MCANYFQRRKTRRPQALRGPRPFGNSLASSSRSGFLALRRCRRVWRLGEAVPQVLLHICFCFLARSGTCVKSVVTGAAEQASTIAAVEIKHSSSLFLRGRGCVRGVFTRARSEGECCSQKSGRRSVWVLQRSDGDPSRKVPVGPWTRAADLFPSADKLS